MPGERTDEGLDALMSRIEILAACSEDEATLTRTIFSDAMRTANAHLKEWMQAAGMSVREDAMGNVTGTLKGRTDQDSALPTLIVGSHLDTVRNAGRYDGMLGVLLGIACAEQLQQADMTLTFNLDVVSFADEESWKYGTAYLGSAAYMGDFDRDWLHHASPDGRTMQEALQTWSHDIGSSIPATHAPPPLLGYLEAHIEQGPALEASGHAVGAVTGIVGQSRAIIRFTGKSGHAGTTPMAMRQDALTAAAECITHVEDTGNTTPGLVATVGAIHTSPNASNVITAHAELSLDVRHAEDPVRESALANILAETESIAHRRGLGVHHDTRFSVATVQADAALAGVLSAAVERHIPGAPTLISGAGHDAAYMARYMPMAMLFIRCKDGLSHHPDESVAPQDIAVARAVLTDCIVTLSQQAEDPS